jgi:uncharacterized phiE125 gp8 family phage protein
MSSILLTGPAVEPVTLAEAKANLRVEHDDDDDVISALIAGARVHVEAQTRRALITQTWRLTRDVWPIDGRVLVLPAPLRELIAARVVMLNGSTQSIDPSLFSADRAGAPAILAFGPGALPMSDRPVAGIELDVEVGYGDAPADVPEPLRLAIKLLIAHWYENRGITASGHEAAVLPYTITALIAPYRVLAL